METNKQFNEVEYLSDASKIRYAIHNMINQYGLLKEGSEKKYFAENHDIYDAPDSEKRIQKNGAFAINFAGKVPSEIVTPFGAIKIHHGQNNLLANADSQAEFMQALQANFGLTAMPDQFGPSHKLSHVRIGRLPMAPVREVNDANLMAVTRLPWKQEKLAMPSHVYHTPDVDLNELRHLTKVLEVTNAKFVQDKHPEFILPGTATSYLINGQTHSVVDAIKIYPNFVQGLEDELAKDYVKAAAGPIREL